MSRDIKYSIQDAVDSLESAVIKIETDALRREISSIINTLVAILEAADDTLS